MNVQPTEVLKTVFQEALEACSPGKILPPFIRTGKRGLRNAGHSLGTGPFHVFASGKAAVSMTNALFNMLANRIVGGTVVSPEENPALPPVFRHFTGDHPLPTSRSLRAGQEMAKAMSGLNYTDTFIYLLSGGSSALMELPIDSISIEDVAAATRTLLKSGLPIGEINRVRIHLSQLKGGGLGKQTQARGNVLVMSDVLNNPLPVIGSGPFRPVKRDYPASVESLREWELWERFPAAVRTAFTTLPAETAPGLHRFPHEIIADNNTLLCGVRAALEKRKILSRTADTALTGEAGKLGKTIAATAIQTAEAMKPGDRLAILFSGEPTVTVTGDGKGGRCQELVLAALTELRGNPAITLLAAGSDGRDGPTDAAGAIADNSVWETALQKKLSPESFLARNDSYRFFEASGGLIRTGPTGINLLDIVIALIQK